MQILCILNLTYFILALELNFLFFGFRSVEILQSLRFLYVLFRIVCFFIMFHTPFGFLDDKRLIPTDLSCGVWTCGYL
jgi:hypothetical protein